MKNSKGFISVTVIYSFFLVFLTLMMFIIVNLVTNRNLLNNMKKTIKNDISDTNFANYLINRYDDLGVLKVNLMEIIQIIMLNLIMKYIE